MTPLSQCDLLKHSRGLFRFRLLMAAAGLSGPVLSLSLAQIHLRFLSRDMQIETGKLQSKRAELLNRRKALISEVEGLKRYETVREYAETRLGLRECLPEQSRRAMISSDAVGRWARPEKNLAGADTSERGLIRVLGEKVISLATISLAKEE